MKKKLVSAIITGLLIFGISIPTEAAYYEDVTLTDRYACVWGFDVVIETLHASGYSYASSGEVKDVWLTTDRCYFPNVVDSEKITTAYHPRGEYAVGTYKLKVGVPSPWGGNWY